MLHHPSDTDHWSAGFSSFQTLCGEENISAWNISDKSRNDHVVIDGLLDVMGSLAPSSGWDGCFHWRRTHCVSPSFFSNEAWWSGKNGKKKKQNSKILLKHTDTQTHAGPWRQHSEQLSSPPTHTHTHEHPKTIFSFHDRSSLSPPPPSLPPVVLSPCVRFHCASSCKSHRRRYILVFNQEEKKTGWRFFCCSALSETFFHSYFFFYIYINMHVCTL